MPASARLCLPQLLAVKLFAPPTSLPPWNQNAAAQLPLSLTRPQQHMATPDVLVDDRRSPSASSGRSIASG